MHHELDSSLTAVMAPAIGTFIIVFLVVGVLSFLIIPVFMGFWTTARFTRRFERLVREGYVDVVLARPHENDTRSAGGRNNKVSAASLCEAWMDIRSSRAYGPAGGGIEDEKEWKARCNAKRVEMVLTDCGLIARFALLQASR